MLLPTRKKYPKILLNSISCRIADNLYLDSIVNELLTYEPDFPGRNYNSGWKSYHYLPSNFAFHLSGSMYCKTTYSFERELKLKKICCQSC